MDMFSYTMPRVSTATQLKMIHEPVTTIGMLVHLAKKLARRPMYAQSAIVACRRVLRMVDVEMTDAAEVPFFRDLAQLKQFRDCVSFAGSLTVCATPDALQEAWNRPPAAYVETIKCVTSSKTTVQSDKASHRLVIAAYQQRAYELAEKCRIQHDADEKKKKREEEEKKTEKEEGKAEQPEGGIPMEYVD